MVFAFPGIMICAVGIITVAFNPSGEMIVNAPPNGLSVLFFKVSGIET